MIRKVIHGGQISDRIDVRFGVRQECLLSTFLFLMVINYSRSSQREKEMGYSAPYGHSSRTWTLLMMSHNHSQMQDKTSGLESIWAKLGFKINKDNTITVDRVPGRSSLHYPPMECAQPARWLRSRCHSKH